MKKCLRWIIAILCLSVTATVCASCGGTETEKTELDAPVIASAVYTGETIKATVPENDGYEVVTNEGGIHAGEYDVVLKLSDESKYAWKNPDEGDATKVTLKFAITQADNEITDFTVADVVFGEATVSPSATAKFGMPTFAYSDSANGTFTDTVPSAVGKYFVKATVAETADYKGADKVVSFRITKKASVFTAEAAAVNDLTYDGSAHALVTAATTDDGTVEYKLGENGEWGESIPEATNAGDYKVYYRIKGDEAHADYEVTDPVIVTIAKANATFTAPTAKTDLVYTGSALELIVAGSVTGGEVQYKLGDGEYGTTVPVATNAGTYTVYYKVIGDDNHNDVAEASLTVTIAKANATFTAPTAKTDLAYTGSALELIVAGSVTGGEVQYKLGTGEYGTTVPVATNAGAYTVYYKVLGDDNHNDVAEASLTVTIAKANVAFTAPTAKTDLAYTGSALELIVAGSATGGEVQYKLDGGEYGTTVPVATNVGTYTVYYKVIGDDNHNDVAEASLTVTIEKANVALTAPTAKTDLAYTGSALELIVAGATNDGEVQYKLGNGEYGTTVPVATNAGTYTVYYKVIGDDNHNDVAEASLTVTIAKAKNVIEFNKDSEGNVTSVDFTYGEDPIQNATATSGEVTYTYISAHWEGDGENKKPVADEGNLVPWNKTNKVGLYLCRMTAGNDNYETVTRDRWVNVYVRETDENGVKYEFDEATGTYGVSGYVGSATEVNVLGTFNDGANGEKAVTFVKENAFNGNVVIKKIVFPLSVTTLKGLAFFNSSSVEYISMAGVTDIGDGGNNLTYCYNLKTLIVHEGLEIELQLLQSNDDTKNGITSVYVDGTEKISYKPDSNKLIKTVYYKGDGVKCFTWTTNADGTIKAGPAAHNYGSDGKCTVCGHYGESLTKGVTYAYADGKYYVSDYAGSATEVTVLGTYNDGEHGEYAVTYVGNGAFKEKAITKVILPESITELGGSVFLNSRSLVYVDMRGVKNLIQVNCAAGPDGSRERNNNFLGCGSSDNPIQIIVAPKFLSDVGQFHDSYVNLYVYGATGTPSTTDIVNVGGRIYYMGDSSKCGYWNFDSDGNIVKSDGSHNFVDGVCENCGRIEDHGVEYVFHKTGENSGEYYVTAYTGSETVVNVLGKYNDGVNGEHAVTYVGKNAFVGNTAITKVVLPESVTLLGGNAFMNCTSLEYVDMCGVKTLYQDNVTAGPDGSTDRNNNFLGCTALKTVVVGSGFNSNVGQFHGTNKPNLYVYGAEGADKAPSTGDAAGMIGNIYYYSQDGASGCWNYVGGVATLHE